LERALVISREAQLRQVEIDTLHSIGSFYYVADPAKAQSVFEQALHVCQETGNRRDEGQAQRDLGFALQAQGKLDQAMPHLEQSLQICRATGDRRNEGWALLALGRIRFVQGHFTKGEAYCEQALAMFHKVRDPPGRRQTLFALTVGARDQGQPEKALAYLEQALQRSRREGNGEAEGHFLGEIGFFLQQEGDYGKAQDYLEQALYVKRETKDRWAEAQGLWYLALLFFCVGDYDRAQALSEEGLDIAHHDGFPIRECQCLATLSLISHYRGDDETTQQYGQQALRSAQEARNVGFQGLAWRILGDAAVGLGHWDEATKVYTRSLEMWQPLERIYGRRRINQDRATELQARLARVALAQSDAALAMRHVEAILGYLKDNPVLHWAFEPLCVYLTCYRVLQANRDPRAEEILNASYHLIQERADKIDDEALRLSYLENVAENREIIALWEETSHP
jgi:tetratricopeptide (TPR) repeat protein